ncbi:AAA family ATPase [Myxococcus sp. K38C18041901]|nr:AAA family ATPase [Myxococcus guangdongensis]
MVKDLIGSGRNLLLLGRPGVGKTTKLREVARVLADDLGKRVMVVDTSNEIGGDGDVPHPGIGGARRMQVSRPDRQHDVMIEAVENHMPEVIIVDEIGTSAEASAARTIAERGVQLVATAHGNTLENLVLNPTLSDLVGGVQTVTLSDDEARRRRTQKTVSERKSPPTFDIVVEMVGRDEVRVHGDTAAAVDRLLAGKDVGGERRRQDAESGRVEVEPARQVAVAAEGRTAPSTGVEPTGQAPESVSASGGTSESVVPFPEPPDELPAPSPEPRTPEPASAEPPPKQTRFSSRFVDEPLEEGPAPAAGPTRIYPHGVGRELLQRVLREIPAEVRLVSRLESADLVVTLRSNANDPRMRRVVAKTGARVESVKRSSSAELRRMLKGFFNVLEGVDAEEVREAVAEAEAAVQRVLREGVLVELSPHQPRVRKLQHRLVSRYRLEAVSHGSEPSRHLVIYPLGAEIDAALAEETEGGA